MKTFFVVIGLTLILTVYLPTQEQTREDHNTIKENLEKLIDGSTAINFH